MAIAALTSTIIFHSDDHLASELADCSPDLTLHPESRLRDRRPHLHLGGLSVRPRVIGDEGEGDLSTCRNLTGIARIETATGGRSLIGDSFVPKHHHSAQHPFHVLTLNLRCGSLSYVQSHIGQIDA